MISEQPTAPADRGPAAEDLVGGRPLHEATWELLLGRAGFVEVAPLVDGVGGDGRFAVAAVTPS